MKNYKIAVIPGDGTGPEVVREGLKVLQAAAQKSGFKYQTTNYDFGGERYLKTKEVLPKTAVKELKTFDAIYLGAIGHPDVKPGILEKGILLKLRFDLDQYINLRPVKLYDERFCPLKNKTPKDIDFVVVRENSEGLYKGLGEFQKKAPKMRWPSKFLITPVKALNAASAMPSSTPAKIANGKSSPCAEKPMC